MINYKKSIVSVATALAITSSALVADYVPLTNTSVDNVWRLFGVNGFANSSGGTTAGVFSITDSLANTVTDQTLDDLFEDGFYQADALGKVKVLSPLTYIQVRIDTTGVVYNESDPVRTIYVALEDGGAPSFAVSYRASLEGFRLEYSTSSDGSNAHSLTINSTNTYSTPVVGQVIQTVAGIPGDEYSAITDLIDYNLANNPGQWAYYDKAEHQDDNATQDESIRLYSYDALNQIWDLYDSGNNAASNDFDSLEKAKAYWGKIDTDTTGTEAGVVLGRDTLTSTDYTDAGITDGWNLIAFDGVNPDIRIASTGLLVDLNNTNDYGKIRLVDASSNHEVDIDINATASDINNSKIINAALKTAKDDGIIPDTFHLKVFPTTTSRLAFISNKRFRLYDMNSTLNAVTTLYGNKPIDPSTGLVAVNPVTELNTTGVQSVYGEYAMVIEPLLGAGTAAVLDTVANTSKLHIKSLSGATGATDANFDMNNSATVLLALPPTVATLSAIAEINATLIDIEYDNEDNHILLTSESPFFVRDHTFSRVFDYTDTDDNNTISITSAGGTTTSGSVAINDENNTATEAAVEINATAILPAIRAGADGNGNIVIVNTNDNGNEFFVAESVDTDHLEDAVSTTDLDNGAVKGIYSLNYFATRPLENIITLDLNATVDDTTDWMKFNINGNGVNADFNVSLVEFNSTIDSEITSFYAKVLSVIRGQLADEYITASVDHNYSSGAVTTGRITITGPDITDIKTVTNEGTGLAANNLSDLNSTNVLGNIALLAPNLESDLKYNAVYTPNYVIDGPLYTMKAAGFTAKAMVTGTMNFSTETISWESIDLTRKPSEWLDSQDYNLFSIDNTSGYWVYLETDGVGNTLAIANPYLSQNYTHHFNADGTNYNHISGNIDIEVQNLGAYDDRESARISVYANAAEIELARVGTSDIYSGKLSSYEAVGITSGANYEILANISDGLGYNLKAEDTTLVIDYQKPATPVIDLTDGVAASFESNSTDVAGYYVYNGQIPESGTETATNKLAYLAAADAAAYSLCANVDALDFGETAYDLNVIAVDGAGVLGKGNVSDTETAAYVPALKEALLITDSNNGDSDPTITGDIYDASCADVGPATVEYGVTVTAETNLRTVKLAINPKNGADLTAIPLTTFVYATGVDVGDIGKITYPSIYAGDRVYIEIGGIVYDFELPTAAQLLASPATYGATSANPADLSSALGNELVGQNL